MPTMLGGIEGDIDKSPPQPLRALVCSMRAFQINFSFPDDVAERIAAYCARDFVLTTGVVGSIAYNRVPKIEARFSPEAFATLTDVSLAELSSIERIADIDHVLISFYTTGTVLARIVSSLAEPDVALVSDEVEKLDAEIFKKSESLVRGVFRLVNRLADAQIILLSKVLPYDGVTVGTIDKTTPHALETAFARCAEWRGWASVDVLLFKPLTTADIRKRLETPPAKLFNAGDISVVATGIVRYWFVEAESFTGEEIANYLEPASYVLAKRSIIAGATETLREASDQFAAGIPTASGRMLRRYKAQVRGALGRCNYFRISSTAQYRTLFAWLEEQLSSLARGQSDYEEAEETARLAIEGNDRAVVERISRALNAVFMLFAAIAFVGVVADALGFVDFENKLPLGLRITIVVLATLLALVAVWWSIRLLSHSDDD